MRMRVWLKWLDLQCADDVSWIRQKRVGRRVRERDGIESIVVCA